MSERVLTDLAYDRRRRNDPALANAKRIRSAARWQKLRAAKLAKNPLCQDPFGHHAEDGRTVAASQVHHITAIVADPAKAYAWSNLLAVCTHCHNRLDRGNNAKP